MADIQKLKDQIWYAKQALADAEKLRNDFVESRDSAKKMLADDPGNAVFSEILSECETELANREAEVAEHVKRVASLEAKLPDEFKSAVPKFDPEKHPILKKTLEKAEPAQPVVFNTGDMCEAYWAADRSWYKAKIMSILGSTSNPKYHVKYLDYDDTQTLDPEHVRPLQAKRKREEATAPAAATAPHVVAGAASVNSGAQPGKEDGAAGGPPKKKKKAPSNKALERSTANWQNFLQKGEGKKTVKESQFRTGTKPQSRVGFTGSGAGMTEAAKRVRYEPTLDERLDRQREAEDAGRREVERRHAEGPVRYSEGRGRGRGRGGSRYSPPHRRPSPPARRRF